MHFPYAGVLASNSVNLQELMKNAKQNSTILAKSRDSVG
jgi:hypothetical protein